MPELDCRLTQSTIDRHEFSLHDLRRGEVLHIVGLEFLEALGERYCARELLPFQAGRYRESDQVNNRALAFVPGQPAQPDIFSND